MRVQRVMLDYYAVAPERREHSLAIWACTQRERTGKASSLFLLGFVRSRVFLTANTFNKPLEVPWVVRSNWDVGATHGMRSDVVQGKGDDGRSQNHC